MEVKNKIAVVTGASSGIGYALSAELVKAGAKVYCLSLDKPAVPVDGVVYLEVDLTQEKAVADAVLQIMEPVDILVNNAGVMRRGHYYEIGADDFDLVWNVAVKGYWLMFKYLRDKLVNGAMTVQINSKNALVKKADTFVYTLSKLADLEIDALVAQDRPDLDMRVAHLARVDTALEWTGYTEAQKAEKIVTALSPERAGELVSELIRSDFTRLVPLGESVEYRME